MRIILLGPPGCGKGTQGELIEKRYCFPKISTGDLLREAVAKGTTLGKMAELQMKQGKLVDDETVIGLVKERIFKEDCQKGYIMDGFPRTISQAESLEELDGIHKEITIEIKVPEEVLINRLSSRRICSNCSAIFHLESAKPKKEGFCDFCEGNLILREDDKPEIVKERLKVYSQKTEPLIDYYQKKKRFFEVDGTGEVGTIFKNISILLDAEMEESKGSEAQR